MDRFFVVLSNCVEVQVEETSHLPVPALSSTVLHSSTEGRSCILGTSCRPISWYGDWPRHCKNQGTCHSQGKPSSLCIEVVFCDLLY